MRLTCLVMGVALSALTGPAHAQVPASRWEDPSEHKVHFVTVEAAVTLEVLEWGESDQAVVLLTGSGNTAHVYDDFASKLTDCCHLFAITRRGFGHSSHPESGYDDQRRADDVLHVIGSLEIEAPVLVGHSLAGSELTTLGAQHSNLISGLIYLDAGADPVDSPWSDTAYREGVQKVASMNPPQVLSTEPSRKDSVEAYHAWQMEQVGFTFSEAEVRNLYEFNPDGSIGEYRGGGVGRAIDGGARRRDYFGITVPVLSIFATPKPPDDRWDDRSPEYRATAEGVDARLMILLDRYQDSLTSAVPHARVLEWPGAKHYLFIAQEAKVLREIRLFVADLGR